MVDSIVTWGGSFFGGVIAIIFLIKIVKDFIQYYKGGGSIKDIIVSVAVFLCALLIIGFAINYSAISDKLGGSTATTITEKVKGEFDTAVGGGSGK